MDAGIDRLLSYIQLCNLVLSNFKKLYITLHIGQKNTENCHRTTSSAQEWSRSETKILLIEHLHLGRILLCFPHPVSLKNWFTKTDDLWMRRLLCPLREDARCFTVAAAFLTELYFSLTTLNKLKQSFMVSVHNSSKRYAQYEMRT
jgi:hypothetical protein